jgi:hypothetical protein
MAARTTASAFEPKRYAAGLEMCCPGGALSQTGSLQFPASGADRAAHHSLQRPDFTSGLPRVGETHGASVPRFSRTADQCPDYRCADKVSRRTRRRGRSRLLTSARTARRTFDLQLAIATLRLPALASRLERIRTIPVVYGGNSAVLFEKRSAGVVADSPMHWRRSTGGDECA